VVGEILNWVARYETQACPSLLIEQSHDWPRPNDLNAGGYGAAGLLLAAGASGGSNLLYLLTCLHQRVYDLWQRLLDCYKRDRWNPIGLRIKLCSMQLKLPESETILLDGLQRAAI
jgi:hypothetical protein